mmetsp:Transcript_8103/g.19867  ORF Transcript_8103/g.19867 Transcript_8103/m.19867 type:complete len:213 (+) Transcript_8103:1828-2466(+)
MVDSSSARLWSWRIAETRDMKPKGPTGSLSLSSSRTSRCQSPRFSSRDWLGTRAWPWETSSVNLARLSRLNSLQRPRNSSSSSVSLQRQRSTANCSVVRSGSLGISPGQRLTVNPSRALIRDRPTRRLSASKSGRFDSASASRSESGLLSWLARARADLEYSVSVRMIVENVPAVRAPLSVSTFSRTSNTSSVRFALQRSLSTCWSVPMSIW